MKFQYLIYKKEEIDKDGKLPAEIQRVFGNLRRHGILVESVKKGTIPQFIKEKGIEADRVLVLTARDETLQEIADMAIASVGYLHRDFPKENLYQADILVEGFEEIDYYFLERIYQRKHGLPWRVIETQRCYLREMTLEDLDDLYDMYAELSMTEYVEPLCEREKEEVYTKAYINNMYRFYGYGMWLVKDRESHELIGRAGLNNLELESENLLEMGYAIKVTCQRMGYATEVCQGIIDYAKGADLGYDKLYCFVREGNEASVALLKKLGFVFEGFRWRDNRRMLVYFCWLSSLQFEK